ncbi:MAG TPA: tRNA lysidine(34) synthetase TilS, partial [Gemmatimonadaceae bacterium]|nr:tRNA lysidine(34) synthetase TilS [Gemmatimonadaceae bacterium]
MKHAEGTKASALVTRAVRAELERGPAVLAVSGGRDSMVLLEAAARVAPERVAVVATFDHGTGEAATSAASLVEARARSLGLEARRGLSAAPATTEAAWRAQRMEFLRATSRELGARMITAHTLDDHVETVLMRALRGSGARGLAGLLAPSHVGRPFLALARSTLGECAQAWRVSFIDDPTNLSRLYLRNRVRLDLLPALGRVRPELASEL